MGAVTVDVKAKTQEHNAPRCVGCGLCMLACERQRAIAMEPVPDYRLPYKSWYALLARAAPGAAKTAFDVWRERR